MKEKLYGAKKVYLKVMIVLTMQLIYRFTTRFSIANSK